MSPATSGSSPSGSPSFAISRYPRWPVSLHAMRKRYFACRLPRLRRETQPMRLFNTLSQRIEPLDIRDQQVSLYVCGITPYDTTHLGHAFINVIYDSLVRYLRWRGAAVRYVQNVTDIDDDILRKARETGMTWDELGTRETERYLRDLRSLNVALPDHYVHASAETAAMTAMIETLLAKNLAYMRDGWVYYSVAQDPDFGKLADAGGYVGYSSWLATANERGNFPH